MARGGGAGVVLLLVLVQAARGASVLSSPYWEDPDSGQALEEGLAACSGLWACLRRDLAANLSDILSADQYNVTPVLAVERLRPATPGVVDRMATSINEGGLPTLAATAIKLFETHALVWKLWPGYFHFKIFNHPGEGMDAAVEIPPNTGELTDTIPRGGHT